MRTINLTSHKNCHTCYYNGEEYFSCNPLLALLGAAIKYHKSKIKIKLKIKLKRQ